MVHAMTQYMDRKNIIQVLPVHGSCMGDDGTPVATPVTTSALVGLKNKMLIILLEPFRVIFVLNHFEGP